MTNVAKKVDHIPPQSNQEISCQQTVFNKTDIYFLSETKKDYSFLGSQFFSESLKMYRKDYVLNMCLC